MFGIGAQEMVVIGLLLLVVFGPGKLPGMARDFGRFVSEARRSVEEFKEDLSSQVEDDPEPRESQALQESRQADKNGGHQGSTAFARGEPPTE